MNEMEIPDSLLHEIEAGNVVLVLGAGASANCKDRNGKTPPLGSGLADLLIARFLNDKYKGYPLDQASELAISETDLLSVQDFIREIFDDFSPSSSHQILTTFRWRAIATTNYDRVIEKAYDANPNSAQKLHTFVSNGENVDRRIRTVVDLQYLKLHGCINRITLSDPELILTCDQYVQYRDKRSNLFERLKLISQDRPVVFIGNRLRDPDLRQLMIEIDKEMKEGRPRYFLIVPAITKEEERMWQGRRISPLIGTFDDFMENLNRKIGASFRGIVPNSSRSTGIAKRFATHNTALSESTLKFLESDVTLVNEYSSKEPVNAQDFYRGFARGFSAIEANLDVKRRLNDTVIERFVIDEQDRQNIELVLIKGPAGAGKSILVKRVAWECAKEYDRLALFVNESGLLFPSSVVELARACNERVYLFFENVLLHQRDVERFLRTANDAGIKLTVIGGVRTNELNTAGGDLEKLAAEAFDLHYLSEKEIRELLGKLEEHDSLGQLARLSPQERFDKLCKKAGRQLLVALHEATLGRPFEQIICDEFQNISPILAKRIYKTICVMYRFGTPVRAGLVKRVHNVGFDEFKDKFFGPLENVVRTIDSERGDDASYVARHQHIAEIVFSRALANPEDKLEALLEVLAAVDLDYTVDREVFYKIVRGRPLIDMFTDRAQAMQVFETASDKSPDDAVLLHQRGVFEMNHPSPNFADADTYLQLALKTNATSRTISSSTERNITHSIAEINLKRASQANSILLKRQYLNQAEQVCRGLISMGASAYERHTLTKIGIERLKTEVQAGELSDDDLSAMLQELEKELSRHLTAVPGDEYLLSAESQLAEFLTQSDRAVKALRKAFTKNQRSVYIALSLARSLVANRESSEAEKVLRDALELNPHEKKLHFLLGKTLLDKGSLDDNELYYHFERSYVPGDGNIQAQLLHARQVFIIDGGARSRNLFAELKKAEVSLSERRRLVYPLPHRKKGRVTDIQANYAFIEIDSTSDRVYAHETKFIPPSWEQLSFGARVEFSIAFSLMGASAFDIKLENQS